MSAAHNFPYRIFTELSLKYPEKVEVLHCYGKMTNINSRQCFTIAKKYIIFAAYISMVVATVTIVYCAVWVPDMRAWCSANKQSNNVQNVDSFLATRDRERAAYESLMHYILHPQAPCLTSRILGGKSRQNGKLDGDKVICLEPGPGIGEDCILYSFGISNEWSFDESVRKNFGCKVYAFDPSMGYDDHVHSDGIWFYNLAIGECDGKVKVNGQMWNVKTLDSILNQLGHKNKTIDILKIDVEGAEYVVLEDILDKGLLNHVNHLCIEIHLRDNPYWTRMLKLLRRIEDEAGLRHFSTRNNTQVPLMPVPGFFARYEQLWFEMAWYRH